MSLPRNGRRVAMLGLALLSLVTGASARDIGELGGSGGNGFRSNCRPNDIIIGFNMRSGTALDAIVPICIATTASRTEWTGQAYEPNLRYFGGGGGVYKKIACKPGFAVTHLHVYLGKTNIVRTDVVNHIRITCKDLDSGAWHDDTPKFDGRPHADRRFACGSGEFATGIFGGHGTLIDRLGLACSTLAVAQRPPQPDPPQPTPQACAPNRGDPVPAAWAEMLTAHNEKRKLHCVCPLSWSASLASGAQAYATQCKIGVHGSTGENLATAVQVSNGVAKLPAKSHAQAFQDAWYSEIKDYDFNNPRFDASPPGVNGHFTQVVWKDSTQLGCGIATCKMKVTMKYPDGRQVDEVHDGTQWVCRYSPIGNMNAGTQAVLRDQVKGATCK